MFELENLYFVITSRSWKFCRMWYLDYHGFEATIRLSTGTNGTQTSNMVRIRTGCLLANQGIPPSYSFKPLQSWTFFLYFHPLPRKRVRLGILPHVPMKRPDLHWWTHVQHGADMYDESKTEDGITDEECSDMEIEYILLPKLKREIRPADLTGDQVFLLVIQMYKMQKRDPSS